MTAAFTIVAAVLAVPWLVSAVALAGLLTRAARPGGGRHRRSGR